MANDRQQAQNNNRPAPAPAKLNAAPFVFDSAKAVTARAWKPSKPTAKTAEQITVALGTVHARIAGSAVTFPMDVQIVFSDKTSTPDVVLRQPWVSAPGGVGGKPLFETDTDEDGAKMIGNLEHITDRFLEQYRAIPVEQRVDLDKLDYAYAGSLVKAKIGGVRRTLARPTV